MVTPTDIATAANQVAHGSHLSRSRAFRGMWLEKDNGVIRTSIPFVAWFNSAVTGAEVRFDFTAPNPPIYHGNPDLFARLSYEGIKARFQEWGFQIHHIIRGTTTESSVVDCYVYLTDSRIPFAVIRPLVFVK